MGLVHLAGIWRERSKESGSSHNLVGGIEGTVEEDLIQLQELEKKM